MAKTAIAVVLGAAALVSTAAVLSRSANKRLAPKPPQLPDADTMRLLTPPTLPNAAEERWDRFIHSDRWTGPKLESDDTNPTAGHRPLTEFERSILGAYFDPRVLDSVIVYNGERPAWVSPTAQIPPQLWSLTVKNVTPDGIRSEIWLPRKVALWHRWWLALLGHEVTHGAQGLMGLTSEQAAEAFKKYGYVRSPVERQARWMQQRILDGLDQMASAGGES